MAENIMEKLVALCKRRGFIYPGSEIYGGLANTYDYGPMGTELMRNLRNLWWETFVQQRDDMVGLEASLISHQDIWKASGHVGGFADALIDCKNCQHRMRADHLIEDYLETTSQSELDEINQRIRNNNPYSEVLSQDVVDKYVETKKVEGLSVEQLTAITKLHKISCPKCKKSDWTDARKFNQLFPVQLGIVVGDQSLAYLRGETAQGMFVDFKNIIDSTRVRLPFGVAQNGKSFRNEITPGNSVFRTLVFEQAEIEYFFDPEKNDWNELFENWKKDIYNFVKEKLGVKKENLRWRTHTDEERSFYSKRTEDLEYNFPFGFKELWGLAYRTDYDLSQHQKYSSRDLTIVDPQTNKKTLPHVIEPAVGIDRLFLMVLADSYIEGEDGRVRLALNPKLAPYQVAVFPLLANKPELIEKARGIYTLLKSMMMVAWDDRGNIGKRYAAQDEIGTPYCVTVDFQTLEDDTVTIRDRDTGEQERIPVKELQSVLQKKTT